MNQYLKNNPVARAIFENHRAERLFENEAVDNVLRTITDACMGIYQKLVFDMAPSRERNPDGTRTKLSPIIDAKDIDGLVAVLRNDSAESGVKSTNYTEAKNLYLQALEKYTEALVSACKVNKANEKFILDYAKNSAQTMQRRTEQLAKSAKEENEAKMNDSESFYFNGELSRLYESGIFTGYKGRVEDLRKLLANLILASNGKTSKNGYGRDWQTTFVDLDEKRKSLDTSKGAFGEKDKKALDDLEAQVDKYRLEFIKASNAAVDKSLAAVESDEELNGSYGDVNTLCDEAKLLKTRADSQYATALTTIKDDHKEKEEVFNKTLFPIKKGDTDADDKFKDSGLIFAIQKALCDGIPAAGKLIKSKGGPNGKYGPATKSVIATLQKMEGNKNVNGDLDQALLSDILSSDWVSDENKKAVHKALDIAKVKMNESLSTVFSFADFAKSSTINENKIVFNNDDFSKELDAQYKETVSSEPLSQEGGTDTKEGDDKSESNKSADVDKLSKLLRVIYGVIKEPETFNRENGSLKQAYSPNFIKAWISALESVKDKEPKSYAYFFYDGGLYRIDSIKTSLKSPCNWPKFEKVDDTDDPKLFLTNYLKPFDDKPIGSLGLINGENRLAAVKKLMDASSSAEDSNDILRTGGMGRVYGKLSAFIVNKEMPYITIDDLKEVKDAFKKAIDDYSDDPDMGYENFIALNNLMVISANMIAYNKNKDNFVSVVKWLHDNLLTETVIDRIMNDNIMSSPSWAKNRNSPSILKFDGKGGIVMVSFNDYQNYIAKHQFTKFDLTKDLSGFSKAVNYESKNSNADKSVPRNAFVINLRKIASSIYPNLKIQLRRINSQQFSDVPQPGKFNCTEVK
jgi:hypothetical protein